MTIHYDIDEFEKLKKRVEKLEQIHKDSKTENYRIEQKKDLMDDNERIVFEFVEKNEGTNIENIIQSLPKAISRKTVYKILSTLENKGFIISQWNEKNRQERSIIVNRKNIVLKVEKEITEFKSNLFLILEKLEKYINEGTINVDKNVYRDITNYLREDYFKFISIYFFRALLQWHQYINDKQVIFQLYTILIMNIMQIQERISKFVLGFVPAIPFYKEICTDDDGLLVQIHAFSDIGIKDEYQSLANSLSKINDTYSMGKLNIN